MIMKKKFLIKVGKCLALAILLAGCTEQGELDSITEDVHPILSFTCEAETRSIVSEFVPGAKIGVSVTKKGTTDAYEDEERNLNICYTLRGANIWDVSFYTTLTQSDAYVYGYYPYTSAINGGKVIMKNGTDYMYTPNPSVINRNHPSAEIKLAHAMAAAFTFDASLGNVNRVRVRNLPESATLDIFTGKVTPSPTTAGVDIQKGDVALSEGLLVVPGNKIDVMVYTDKGNFVWKPEQTAESGIMYHIKLSAK